MENKKQNKRYFLTSKQTHHEEAYQSYHKWRIKSLSVLLGILEPYIDFNSIQRGPIRSIFNYIQKFQLL